MRSFYLSLFLFALSPFMLFSVSQQPHHTTAFIGAPGEVSILTSYSRYSTDHFWNRHGNKKPSFNHFSSHSFLLYAEYALNCHNSIFVSGGYSRVLEKLNGNSQGVEDIELGWKTALYENDCAVLTGQLIGIIPVEDKKSSIRYGKAGLELDLLYSDTFSFFNRSGWMDLGIGYRFYEGFPSDQVRANAALGYCLAPWFRIIASTQLDYGVFNGKSRKNLNNIIYHPNYRLLEGQIEGVLSLCPYAAISVGGFQHLWGQNVGTGGGFFCGLWVNF